MLLNVIKIKIVGGTDVKLQLSFWKIFAVISYVKLKRVCKIDSSSINIGST